MSRVFIPQRSNRNFSAARRFTDQPFVFLCNKEVYADNFEDVIPSIIGGIHIKLMGFTLNDYLLLSGDPVVLSLVTMTMARMGKYHVKFLKFDKENAAYYPVPVDLTLFEESTRQLYERTIWKDHPSTSTT